MSGSHGLRGAIVFEVLILFVSAAGGCGDLLQEPDTGINTLVDMTPVSGGGQTGAPGSTLPQAIRVRLLSLNGGSTDRLMIEWVEIDGGGSVSPRYSFADADGIAETTWTLGPGPDRQRIEARFGGEVEVFEAQLAGN